MRSMLTATLLAALALSACAKPKPGITASNDVMQLCAGDPTVTSQKIVEAEWHAMSGIKALDKAGNSEMEKSRNVQSAASGCQCPHC